MSSGPSCRSTFSSSWVKTPRTSSGANATTIGLACSSIVEPKSGYLLIHGDDAPIAMPDCLPLVKGRFQLPGVNITPEFTEHEKSLVKDPKNVQAVLGISLDLKTTA